MTGCELMWSQKTRRSEVSFQFEQDKGISVPQLISKNLLHFIIGPQKVLDPDPRLKTIESPNKGTVCYAFYLLFSGRSLENMALFSFVVVWLQLDIGCACG